ncbi:MAG: hypothetical protein LBT63_01675 [Holosporaceae bacterium]|jgi:hypothetical protein|nr:hypothetical protein [Holosporaceae bacterium]
MQQINDLLDAKLLENHRNQEKRDYLGASIIGGDCLRQIQLQYMQKEQEFSAQTLRTFAIGHCLEDLIADWMILAGFDLRTRDENGEQFGFSTAEGKLKGHVDGIIFGGPDFCKYPALWECKTLNNKSWNDTAKRGVLVTKSLYFAQVQLYMTYLNLDENPCLFTALNKDTSELYHELIAFDAEAAQRYSDRAVQIIKASENNEMMPCISSDSSFYKCKMCSYRQECLRQRGFCE